MPLHKRESVREELLDSVYASRDFMRALPMSKFPAAEVVPAVAFQAIADELLLDGNARQNLATFCQTWEEPEIHGLMDISIDKNLIDKDEYPQTAELERRCLGQAGDRVLGRGVVREVTDSDLGRHRGGVDDHAASRTAHRIQHRLDPEEVTGEVHVDDAPPATLLDL